MATADKEHLRISQVFEQIQRDFEVEGHWCWSGKQTRNGGPRQMDHAVPRSGQICKGSWILEIHDQGFDIRWEVHGDAAIQSRHLMAQVNQRLSHVAAVEA